MPEAQELATPPKGAAKDQLKVVMSDIPCGNLWDDLEEVGRAGYQVLNQILPVTEFCVVIWRDMKASGVLVEGPLQVTKDYNLAGRDGAMIQIIPMI